MIPFNAKQNTPHHSGYKIFVLNMYIYVRITHPRLSGIITFTNRFTPVLNTRRRAAWFLIKAV